MLPLLACSSFLLLPSSRPFQEHGIEISTHSFLLSDPFIVVSAMWYISSVIPAVRTLLRVDSIPQKEEAPTRGSIPGLDASESEHENDENACCGRRLGFVINKMVSEHGDALRGVGTGNNSNSGDNYRPMRPGRR